MKNLILFFLFTYTITASAQICVGEADYFNERSKKNSNEDIARFKSAKTIFVLPDIYSVEEYQKIITETWNINKYELVTREEFEKNEAKYKQVNSAIAEYTGFLITTSSSGSTVSEHIFYLIDFYLIDDVKEKKKKTVYKKTSLASVFFTLDYAKMKEDNITNYLKAKPNHLKNYKLGYLKNYFHKINNDLKKNENFNGFDEFVNESKLKVLKTKEIIFTNDIVGADTSLLNKNDRELEELLSEYKYKYKVISKDELNDKILKNEDCYYFTYSQINAKKILTITNAKSGEVIYNYMNRMSYSLKEKDFKQIYKEINKS